MSNPYESPLSAGGMGMGPGPSQYASDKASLPGLFLIIAGGLGIAYMALSLVLNMLGMGMAAGAGGGGDQALAQMVGGGVGMVINVVILIINGVTLYSGIKMRSLESYGLCMTGAILACIPLCSPCCVLGIPFGIWALVVLNDAQVKAAFRG